MSSEHRAAMEQLRQKSQRGMSRTPQPIMSHRSSRTPQPIMSHRSSTPVDRNVFAARRRTDQRAVRVKDTLDTITHGNIPKEYHSRSSSAQPYVQQEHSHKTQFSQSMYEKPVGDLARQSGSYRRTVFSNGAIVAPLTPHSRPLVYCAVAVPRCVAERHAPRSSSNL